MNNQKTFDDEEQYHRILPKIKCEVCGREFEKITSTHLRKHNITVYEYKEQFPDALLVSEDWCKKLREVNVGKKASEATKQKMSENHADFRGENSSLYGKKRPEHSERIKGKNHPMYGKHLSEATKLLISEAQLGEKSPNWKGGISFEPYCIKFDYNLKERVREFFNRCCYVCGKSEQEQIEEIINNGKKPLKKLDVHHVNYDKMVCCNDVKPLFVPLCRSCHMKTQKDREYWEEFFTVSLEYLTDGECFLPKSNSKNISLKYQ